jgi:bacillithiol system protein YtxJ
MVWHLFMRKSMKWRRLETRDDLGVLDDLSRERPVVIFKHSTRCLLSSMVLGRLERGLKDAGNDDWFFLDLLRHRDLSDAVAARYDVEHASPQVLVIRDGQCLYANSHNAIDHAEVSSMLQDG